MTMDQVIDGLAVIGAVSCLYWLARALLAFLAWVERSEIERQARESDAEATGALSTAVAVGAASTVAMGGIPPEHVAAIAAAVAMIGGHRLIRIQDETGGRAWTSEGRWLHQTSHRTH
ncbi:MAG: hypothetical protein GX458_23020 [Phyllobacteriaceae bacterium]|nr:hypothetical protein [Phyllobacteriaceae bacterium]